MVSVMVMTSVNSFAAEPVIGLGDMNGDGKISPVDALVLLQASAALIVLSETQQLVADANFDGSINPIDALVVLQRASRLVNYVEDDFSGDMSKWTSISGNWVIQDETLIQDGTGDGMLLLNDISSLNQTIEVRFKVADSGYVGIILWYIDASNFITVRAYPSISRIFVEETVNGIYSYEEYFRRFNINAWNIFKVVVAQGEIKVFINNSSNINYSVRAVSQGLNGLLSNGNDVFLDDFKLLY